MIEIDDVQDRLNTARSRGKQIRGLVVGKYTKRKYADKFWVSIGTVNYNGKYKALWDVHAGEGFKHLPQIHKVVQLFAE